MTYFWSFLGHLMNFIQRSNSICKQCFLPSKDRRMCPAHSRSPLLWGETIMTKETNLQPGLHAPWKRLNNIFIAGNLLFQWQTIWIHRKATVADISKVCVVTNLWLSVLDTPTNVLYLSLQKCHVTIYTVSCHSYMTKGAGYPCLQYMF